MFFEKSISYVNVFEGGKHLNLFKWLGEGRRHRRRNQDGKLCGICVAYAA
jgi:hypothetical protein